MMRKIAIVALAAAVGGPGTLAATVVGSPADRPAADAGAPGRVAEEPAAAETGPAARAPGAPAELPPPPRSGSDDPGVGTTTTLPRGGGVDRIPDRIPGDYH
jgi:hypothetical protein